METSITSSAPATTTPTPAAATSSAPASTSAPVISTGTETKASSSEAYGALATDWYKGLPEDIREEATLKNFNNLEGLARSVIHFRKAVGSDKVVVPSKHATEQDWKEFWNKVGVPQKLEDYNIEYSKDQIKNEDMVNKFKAFAHEKGLFPKQASEMLNYMVQQEAQDREVQKQAQTKNIQTWEESLKKELGDDFQNELTKARAALAHVNNPGLVKILEETGLGSHPDVVKGFAKLGNFLSEDVIKGSVDSKINAVAELSEKIDSIVRNPEHPYNLKNHPGHKSALREVQQLFERKYAGQELEGSTKEETFRIDEMNMV